MVARAHTYPAQCNAAAEQQPEGWRFVPDTILPGYQWAHQWDPARTPTVQWGQISGKAVGGPNHSSAQQYSAETLQTTGHADSETTEGLRADPFTGEVDFHNTVCGWCAQAHVPIHSCDLTNGCFQGQEIGQILLCHIPKGVATSGAILGSRLSIYGTMGARADVTNFVLQKFSTSKEAHEAKGNSERVQSIAHDERYDLKQEATTSKVHQGRFYSRCRLDGRRDTLWSLFPYFEDSKYV